METIRSAGRVSSEAELSLLFRGLEGLERMVGVVRETGEPPGPDATLLAALSESEAASEPEPTADETPPDGPAPTGSPPDEPAEVVTLPTGPDGFAPGDVIDTLRARGLRRVLVEGGGITVSRFLADGLLDRLHLTVAPMLLGSGRPAIRVRRCLQ